MIDTSIYSSLRNMGGPDVRGGVRPHVHPVRHQFQVLAE